MDYLSLLLLASFVWISIQILISKRLLGIKTPRSLKLPPGPNPFPIIGNILELSNQPHQALAKLSQTYGPIMTLKLGNITTIVISSPQLAKEVLHKNDLIFSYRTVPDTLKALDHHIHSMGWMQPSPLWRTLRKVCATKVFSLQQLDSTQIIRQKKLKELADFVKEKSEKGEILDINEAIFITVLNSMSSTLFSMNLVNFGGSKSQEFKEIVCGITEEAAKPNVVDFFPSLRIFDPQGARARMTKHFRKIINIFDGIVEERLRLRALEMDTKEYKDVLDYLLEVMLEENSQISRIHVLHLLLDLFVAGLDTTSITIEWAMAELLRNPEKMQKLKEELEHVLGKDEKQIEESNISNLPFLGAVVKETLRFHTPIPFLLPHKSQEDVELCGFTVPKNAQVWVNVWAMGRDSSIWTNPNEFMPERFLESKIDFKGQNFELIPFGAGRRICPGLPLAYRTIHIVLGTLVHVYDWKLVNGQKAKDLDMSENFGLTLHKAQSLQAIPMKSQPMF